MEENIKVLIGYYEKELLRLENIKLHYENIGAWCDRASEACDVIPYLEEVVDLLKSSLDPNIKITALCN